MKCCNINETLGTTDMSAVEGRLLSQVSSSVTASRLDTIY